MAQQQVKYEEPVIDKKDYSPELSFAENRLAIILKAKSDKPKIQEVRLHGKPFGRFLAFMDMGQRKFVDMCYRKESTRSGRLKRVFIGTGNAQKWLTTAYKKLEKTKHFKLLLADGRAVRITSEKYIGVPHSFVQEVIENRLKAEGFDFVKTVNRRGTIGEYELITKDSITKQEAMKQLAKTQAAHQISGGIAMSSTVRYVNYNTGDRSLNLFGGGKVLVCANGMISNKVSNKMRMLHKIELKDVRTKLERAITEIIKNIEPIRKELLKLRKVKITKEEAKKFVEILPFPKYMQEAVWTRLFTESKETQNGKMDWDETLWGIYMSATYIASHSDTLKKGRKEKEINDEYRVKLSAVETFSETWDKREQEYEKLEAKKLEVKQK